jgi:hypothetical protein
MMARQFALEVYRQSVQEKRATQSTGRKGEGTVKLPSILKHTEGTATGKNICAYVEQSKSAGPRATDANRTAHLTVSNPKNVFNCQNAKSGPSCRQIFPFTTTHPAVELTSPISPPPLRAYVSLNSRQQAATTTTGCTRPGTGDFPREPTTSWGITSERRRRLGCSGWRMRCRTWR